MANTDILQQPLFLKVAYTVMVYLVHRVDGIYAEIFSEPSLLLFKRDA
jgi:hypothetical protein